MREPRILADEHIPRTVVKRLESFGANTKTIRNIEEKGTSDTEILDIAERENRIILTLDSDFVSLASEKSNPGILYFTKRMNKKEMTAEVMKALNSLKQEDIEDELIYLPWSEQE